ncbi:MAG TPA: prolipoprotein diacylglyceryl transferase [Alphaproteobacteria bacterium]|nr:prolipoprotein diacylglyceryl transferase [Alphaproteobacteria bacterium]
MDPIAFQHGFITIHWYGVMIALAFMAGLWTATLRARREDISAERIGDVVLWLMVGSILGARVVYVTTYWHEEFAGQPIFEIFAIWHGGLVYYGGLIGGIAGALAYMLWKKMPIWKTADVLAPSIALGSFFGRMGCLLNGCCYGRQTDLPWAITFTNPLAHELSNTPLNVPLHPTQIYDGVLNLALYAFLAWLFKRKKFDGQIFATYLICYAILRSVVEHYRGDYSGLHYHLGLTPAQWISVPMFIIGLAMAAILSRRTEPKQT